MKALIIKKEWLDRIFDDGKIWEMRSRRTNITGWILLIESGSGTIVGKAKLTECMPSIRKYKADVFYKYHKIKDDSLLKKWKYPWVLRFAQRYENPIPYNHPKGAVVWVNINEDTSDKTLDDK